MSMLGPVCTAMATPFAPDGSLDPDGAARLATHLVDTGTTTVLVHGTTGESPTLKLEEVWDLLAAVRDAVGGRAKIMVGTGSNDTDHAIATTRRATELGADAILLVTPYYNKPDQRMLLDHFTVVAAATDLPVVLYDIPGRTAREIALETLVALADVDNIVGVKDAVGDFVKAAELLARTDGFELYSGADELNLPYLAVGAVGFVSVASHFAGRELADMATAFPTDPVKAREIHQRLLPLCRALFLESSPAPLKGALNRFGLPGGPVRRPLLDAEEATVDAVVAAIEHAGITLP